MVDPAVRLWTIHPRYLDDEALREAWRDGLNLRRALKIGSKAAEPCPDAAPWIAESRQPVRALDLYLHAIHGEARRRGRSFDASKLGPVDTKTKIPIPSSWVSADWRDLRAIVAKRSPGFFPRIESVQRPHCHPAFRRVSTPSP